MSNYRLRDALARIGCSPERLADDLAVDVKTVQRWITLGRLPYRRHRQRIGALVRESEAYLWPDALDDEQRSVVGRSELVDLYPRRADAPAGLWTRLLVEAVDQVDVLVFAGLFLPEQNPRAVELMAARTTAGAKVRLVLGDPDCAAVALRGEEEGIDEAIAHKIRNVLVHYQPLVDVTGVDVRLHGTTLYNSIYRFDDDMLVSLHVHGLPAAHAPLLHLRRLSEADLFLTYAASFERIWSGAVPAWS